MVRIMELRRQGQPSMMWRGPDGKLNVIPVQERNIRSMPGRSVETQQTSRWDRMATQAMRHVTEEEEEENAKKSEKANEAMQALLAQEEQHEQAHESKNDRNKRKKVRQKATTMSDKRCFMTGQALNYKSFQCCPC